MSSGHSFHIPVMGIGYTVDTPLKVSQWGISAVMSIGDDALLETLRKFYAEKHGLPYSEIPKSDIDHRAKRTTLYLNLINRLCKEKFEAFKNAMAENDALREEYFQMLPAHAELRIKYEQHKHDFIDAAVFRAWADANLEMGSLDVNIMTKADKENYENGEKLPATYNDAHAALRGFAESDLSSSIVFSAGMNPRLYSYTESFPDFFPDASGNFKKKIVLKVSDFRSARIQGNFLAKKGLWVSEYRIESGLNCGGHAFATDGQLMGPILEEFKNNRETLLNELRAVCVRVWTEKGIPVPEKGPDCKITAQGGVGTAEEHSFLLNHYHLDSIGWGSPFLLVPEVVNIDQETLDKLVVAKEEDILLSSVSPLGVPFNTLKGNTKDADKFFRVSSGRPGSPCSKKHLSFNAEFTALPVCTASRKYQHLKINELNQQQLPESEYNERYMAIVEKECLCTGLGQAALLVNGIPTPKGEFGVSVCPGPNIAYFTKITDMKTMVDHIYGRCNLIDRNDRPHMFVKELGLNIAFFKSKLKGMTNTSDEKEFKSLNVFNENLLKGVQFYTDLFSNTSLFNPTISKNSLKTLEAFREDLLFSVENSPMGAELVR